MKDITLKEVVEYYFDRHIALPCIYYNAGDKKMWNRTIESYNPMTGDFRLAKCKDVFNIKESFITIVIGDHDEGWADLVCRHAFGKTFEDIQNLIERNVASDDPNTTVSDLGGSWMKYASSYPRVIKTVIMGEPVEAVITYSTVTNIKVGPYYCGYRYSNTSSRWAYEAGLTNHHEYFDKNTGNGLGD